MMVEMMDSLQGRLWWNFFIEKLILIKRMNGPKVNSICSRPFELEKRNVLNLIPSQMKNEPHFQSSKLLHTFYKGLVIEIQITLHKHDRWL